MSSYPAHIADRIETWLNGAYDAATKEEIRHLLATDPAQLADAFSAHLTFGTGGMRGLMGVGTCRLNSYTIQFATQGLADYLLQGKKNPSVLIGFDSRHHSQEFAETAARVLAGNGITVYFLPKLRPTPYVSFGCRHYGCDAAIMITASHNPKQYNGYKVYGSDGAQVVHPQDTAIVKAAEKISSPEQVKLVTFDSPLIHLVDLEACDNAYLDAIKPLQRAFPKGDAPSIVYTSLHGTGITLAPRALAQWGFTTCHLVPIQTEPNGDFPTTPFPNPEDRKALDLGLVAMKEHHADLLIANDPDADRIGIACQHKGQPFMFNGNQIAVLCVDYLCEVMPTKGTFVTTIVSTDLIRKIAESNGFSCVEVLTGFKYIGEKIREWESTGERFVFGAEESYGYLLGTASRDKDGIVTACLIAEMTLYAKRANQTLVDRLYQIYKHYGVYLDGQTSIEKGMEAMTAWMHRLRTSPLKEIAGIAVIAQTDYLPRADVLALHLEEGSRVIIRPSGTEPKIKIYASTHCPPHDDVEGQMATCDKTLQRLLNFWKTHDA